MIFVNLPVTDLTARSPSMKRSAREGAAIHQRSAAAMMVLSDTIIVMLLTHDFYKTFTGKPIADAHRYEPGAAGPSADSTAEVDATVDKAIAAGGAPIRLRSRTWAASCTAAASRIPTATSGKSCGWTPAAAEQGASALEEA